MTKAASKGPKASVQYVRTLAKRMDRANLRCREERGEVKDLWDAIYLLFSLVDPEILGVALTATPVSIPPTFQKLLFKHSDEEE